ncbi:hypothetical protein [Chelatococcus reniformis]|uniref:Uncharacterized protein n=1 Tax=Chelatococcus reniformis TaxID=1494448 RepID=A0A916UL04_9HYPH|nr:hypothetical protein [Chelatococcus reniformis]GGC76881.1 hypothetical protein GCM10010994_39000 [Chelatococcus reniformis]
MSFWRKLALAAVAAFALPLAAPAQSAMAQGISIRGLGPAVVQTDRVRIVSVDRATRNVVVERGGRQWRITVPAAFGSLAAVRRRDRLEISRVEGALISVAPARANARPDISFAETRDDGTFNNLPARWVTRSVTITARFTSFNAARGIASFVGPDGPRTIRATDPAVVNMLRGLRQGDMINVVFAEATQILLTPRRF